MNNFSKLSLYDFLTMLIPGFVILWLLDFFGLNTKNAVNDIFIGILSYLMGLCYHKFVELLFRGSFFKKLRKCMKKNARTNFYEEYEEIEKEEEKKPRKVSFPEDKDINKYYTAAYYKIAKNGCLMNIPVLEAQEAFLRNAFLLILMAICKITCCNIAYCSCCLVFFLVIILVLDIVVWFSLQKKIYYLVWEGNYYLTRGDEILSKTL